MTFKLGRIPEFDDRSLDFSIRKVVAEVAEPISQIWECPLTLNQGEISACVGFSWIHNISSTPEPTTGLNESTAINIYHLAQQLDDFPGTNYEGTSVLAGIKAVEQSFPDVFESYHWAFSLQDLILAIGHIGPVTIGVNWYSKMFDVNKSGLIQIGGSLVGGHALLAIGVSLEEEIILLLNSWGPSWGVNGQAKISFKHMERLLHERGDACVATGKKTCNVTTPIIPVTPKRKPKHIGAG